MKSGAVTVLNESNFNFNFNNNNKNNNNHQTKNKKSVRFAADESLQINKVKIKNIFLYIGPIIFYLFHSFRLTKKREKNRIKSSIL